MSLTVTFDSSSSSLILSDALQSLASLERLRDMTSIFRSSDMSGVLAIRSRPSSSSIVCRSSTKDLRWMFLSGVWSISEKASSMTETALAVSILSRSDSARVCLAAKNDRPSSPVARDESASRES